MSNTNSISIKGRQSRNTINQLIEIAEILLKGKTILIAGCNENKAYDYKRYLLKHLMVDADIKPCYYQPPFRIQLKSQGEDVYFAGIYQPPKRLSGYSFTLKK